MKPQYTLKAPNKNPLEPIINWYETFDAPTIELKQFPDNVHLVETPEALKEIFTQNTADLVLIDSPSGGGKNVAKRELIAAIAGPDYDPSKPSTSPAAIVNADEYLYGKTLSADTDSDTLKDHKLKFPTSGHFWEGYINYQQVSAFVKKLLEAKKEGIYGSFAPDQNAVTYDRSDRSNPHMALAGDRTDLNSTLKNEKSPIIVDGTGSLRLLKDFSDVQTDRVIVAATFEEVMCSGLLRDEDEGRGEINVERALFRAHEYQAMAIRMGINFQRALQTSSGRTIIVRDTNYLADLQERALRHPNLKRVLQVALASENYARHCTGTYSKKIAETLASRLSTFVDI